MKLKIIILLMTVLTAFQVNAQSLTLNQNQQNLILSDLNNICGDTWCEGDYDLNFQSLYFKAGESRNIYVLEFSAKNTYESNAPIQLVACEIEDVELIQKITTSGLPTINQDLQSELYKKIDTCVYEHLYNK